MLGILFFALTHLLLADGPHFDVASVKVSDLPYLSLRMTRSGGHITWTTDMRYLMEYAYNLQRWRISGPLPDSRFIYTVDAVTSPETTDDQLRLMFQSLLAERFKLAVHRSTKEVEGFAMTLAKGGPKMEEARDNGKNPPDPKLDGRVIATLPKSGAIHVVGQRANMQALRDRLQTDSSGAVFDLTGLTAVYNFTFDYARDDSPADGTLPALSTALSDLGIKLTRHKGPVEMLVIDHIETTPTEN